MTAEIHRDISTTPSTAIHQALDDLEAIRATPGYEIAMDTWWSFDGSLCTLCFGGCLMAGVLDHHPNLVRQYPDLSPGAMLNLGLITREQHAVIEAMDDIRENEYQDIERGLYKMNVPSDVAERVVGGFTYTSYDADPDLFIGERRQLAKALEYEGY